MHKLWNGQNLQTGAPIAGLPDVFFVNTDSAWGYYFNEANKDPLLKRTEEDGNILVGSTPEQLRQHMAAELELWRKLVRETGMKFDGV